MVLYQSIQNDGLTITFRKILPPLDQFVQLMYEAKGRPTLGGQRVFPRDGVELNFNLGKQVRARTLKDKTEISCSDCLVLGNRSAYFDYSPREYIHLFIIKFTYNGFYKLFNIGQNNFGDAHILFDSLFRKSADFLNEKLLSAQSSHERFSLLVHWLKNAYYAKKDKGHYIVPYLINEIRDHPMKRIKTLEKETGFSRKHLFTTFKNETGLSPKQYQRVIRFHQMLKKVRTRPNWLDMAFEMGFYDQSHFIRDVKHFTGMSPNKLLQSRFSPEAKVLPILDSWR